MFKLEKLILKGFDGLSLNQIETFEISKFQDINIILGRNGSGKSTIMGLFFPIAPAKRKFVDGGLYENISETTSGRLQFRVVCKNNTLKCSIKNLDTSVYICKDVNPKVYNNHVETLTGLTPAVVKLLTGKERFTEMSTLQRKAWLDRFSSCDMTYALGYYKRLKDELRNSVAVEKHYKGLLAEATENLIGLKEDHEEIDKRLQTVDFEMQQVNQDIAAIPAPEINVDEAYLFAHFEQTEKLAKVFNKPVVFNYTEEDRFKTKTQIEVLYSTLGEISHAHLDALDAYNRVEDKRQRCAYYLKNLEPALLKKAELENMLETLNGKFYEFAGFGDLDEDVLKTARGVLNEDYIRIDQLSDILKVNGGIKAAASEVSFSQTKVDDARRMLSKIQQTVNENNHLLAHFNNVETVECPKCTHSFKPGMSNTNPDKLREELELCHNQEVKINEVLAEYQREHAELLCTYNALREIQDWMMRNIGNPALAMLINKIASDRVVQENPRRLHLCFKNAMADIDTALETIGTKTRLAHVVNQLSVGENDSSDLENYVKETAALSARLEQLTEQKKQIELEIKNEKDKLTTIDMVLKSKEEFMAMVSDADRVVDMYITTTARKELYNKRELLTEQWIALREKSLKAKDQRDHVANLERDYQAVVNSTDVKRKMIDWMSPEKGLLKRYYYNTVMRVVEWMNITLEEIWDYPLEIQPCPLTDNELSYTFPFQYGNDLKEVPDVCDGSDAQRQIFDLVFRMMAYKALNLVKYPLLLDEPGSGFDEHHRVRFIDYVRQTINDGEFSQLGLISHYGSVHSRLNKASFIVVDPEGITLPATYNEDVKIGYYGG